MGRGGEGERGEGEGERGEGEIICSVEHILTLLTLDTYIYYIIWSQPAELPW